MTTRQSTGKSKPEKTIRWEAPAFQYIEKTADWYWVVGIIGFLVSLGAYIIGNWSFAILLAVSTAVLGYLASRRPRSVTVSLTRNAIVIDDKTYYIKEYEAFHIDKDRSKLLLRSLKSYVPLRVVPLPEDSPSDKIENILETELGLHRDVELSEPTVEIILHNLGF